MNAPASASERLARLDGYLRQDPGNAALLADACDTAIACGAHEAALGYIEAAERLAVDPAGWSFRRARWSMVRGDLAEAQRLLAALRAGGFDHPAVVHDLAYVHLLQGDAAACRALLQPWVDAAPAQGDGAAAIEALWLRAMHWLQLLDEAWSWAEPRRGSMGPAATGVASLIALDLEQFDAALELADAALAADGAQPEALVTRGSLALAAGDMELAERLLQRALELRPQEGRSWSALGLSSLQQGDLPLAESRLEQAVRWLPEHAASWLALGWACLLQGKREAARAAFERALQVDAESAEAHGALALACLQEGDTRAARAHLELAHTLDAQNFTGRFAQALVAGGATDPARLEALLRQLLDRPGFFGRTLVEAAAARLRRGH